MFKTEKATKLVENYLKRKQIVNHQNKLGYDFAIPSEAGDLLVTMHTPKKREKIFSVYCRFIDVDKGYELTSNSNQYSGKWNFHSFTKNYTAEALAGAIIAQLHMIS